MALAANLPVLKKVQIMPETRSPGPTVTIAPLVDMVAQTSDEPQTVAEVSITMCGPHSLSSIDGILRCVEAYAQDKEDSSGGQETNEGSIPSSTPTHEAERSANSKTNIETRETASPRSEGRSSFREIICGLHDLQLVETYASAKLLGCEIAASMCLDQIVKRLGGPRLEKRTNDGGAAQNASALLLPLAVVAASNYLDKTLLVRCYWVLKEIASNLSFPPSWTVNAGAVLSGTDGQSPALPPLSLDLDDSEESAMASLFERNPPASSSSTAPKSLPRSLVSWGGGFIQIGALQVPLSVFRPIVQADKLQKKDVANPPQG
eukprot:GHVN01011306.1.p1 GENE.GHVN01011306.1~~GHVN01011306.1.p1  ORF type:complete len:340 (-),score=24.34 GHVN01011306.1:729-1688(-)